MASTANKTTTNKSSETAPAPEPQFDVLAPWGPSGPPEAGSWVPDILGPGFQCRTLDLLPDSEGDCVATLVKHQPADDPTYLTGTSPWLPLPAPPQSQPSLVVLYLHGRNDYFFQVEMARELSAMGTAFYALDLRKYGRSLRPHQTIGYTDDLSTYDEEIGISIELIQSEHPGLPIILMGHSTGGLIATLWCYRHPGAVSGLILNSGWLELQALAQFRPAMQQVVGRLASRNPMATVISAKSDIYGKSLAYGRAGTDLPLPPNIAAQAKEPGSRILDDPSICGWQFELAWKRLSSYPVPAAWLQAIMDGQAEVEKFVRLDLPVLSLCAGKSTEEEWSENLFTCDVVLNAELIVERSASLSNLVTIARLPGRHDLTLSDPEVRENFYTIIGDWLSFVG